jgi:DNA polymerase-3 subunit epsilon
VTSLYRDLVARGTTLVVIDFEALTPAGRPAEPTEVAALALTPRGGNLVEDGRFESLIQPPQDVPVTARDLSHGMTENELRAAPPAADVMGRLDALLTGPSYRLVAQHASTEAGLIARQAPHCPVLAGLPVLDTIPMAKRVCGRLPSFGLDALMRYYDIPRPAGRHRAMPDVEVTAQILRRLLDQGAAAGYWSSLLDLDRAARLRPRTTTQPARQEGLFG